MVSGQRMSKTLIHKSYGKVQQKRNDEIYKLISWSSSMQLQLTVNYQRLKEETEKLKMEDT